MGLFVEKELIVAKTTIVVNGNLGKDPEVKFSKAGKQYSVLTVGSTPSKKNASGEWENGQTMWFNVTVFEELNPFEFKKGAPVRVEGSFVFRTFDKRDGSQGFALDVVANSIEVVQRKAGAVMGADTAKQWRDEPVVPSSWTPVSDDTPF